MRKLPNKAAAAIVTLSVTATAALLALSVTGCAETSREKMQIRRTWPAGQITELRMVGSNGKIRINAVPTAEILLEVQARVGDGDSENDVLVTRIEGDTLYIEEKKRKHRWSLFGDDRRLDMTIHLPPDVELDINNVNGRIEVVGTDSRMELRSVNGRIEVETPGGELTARTVNGSVYADFTERFPGARLKTVNGSVKVRVPENSEIDTDIHQVNGSFRSDIPVRMSGGRGVPLEVTTVNGSVTLSRMAAAPGAPAAPEPPVVPEVPVPPAPPAS